MIYMNVYKLKPMKRSYVLFSIILLASFCRVSAQNPNIEKLNAYKIAFFTKKLDLTSKEAERFWPVYNESQNEKNQLQIEKVSLMRLFNQGESTMSDNQVTELGDKYCAVLVQESALAVTFHKKLQEILPPRKVIRVYQAENQYRLQLLNELQDRRQGQALRGNLNKR
jgi:hypothetical protein